MTDSQTKSIHSHRTCKSVHSYKINVANESVYSHTANKGIESLGSSSPKIILISRPVIHNHFLVAQHNDFNNVERFYYLLGSLQGDAHQTIRNIAVSD